jgi:[acyl-carrier-protein] S-malonyltransferase
MSLNRRSSTDHFASLVDAPVNPGLVLLFPGQGTQRVGMGKDVFNEFRSSHDVFAAADEACGEPISELCFHGPEDRLTETENAQPAMLTVAAAYLAAALESGALKGRPVFVAGHSLGEYTALVAAHSLSLLDAVSLVKERGRAMSEAGKKQPGTMAAVLGLDEETVTDICARSGAEPANYNGPTQVVIGGAPDAVARAIEIAKSAGAKALSLNVSGAFHTSLMASAGESFSQFLESTEIREPLIPVISNVTGFALTTSDEIRDDLRQQMLKPVKWNAGIQYLLSKGADTFIEVGPGRTLTGMLKRISPDVKTSNIDSLESLAGAISV